MLFCNFFNIIFVFWEINFVGFKVGLGADLVCYIFAVPVNTEFLIFETWSTGKKVILFIDIKSALKLFYAIYKFVYNHWPLYIEFEKVLLIFHYKRKNEKET